MRRKFMRLPLRGYPVRAETVIETSAQIADLSIKGLRIMTPKRMTPGSTCMVTIGNNGAPMILKGTTVWERYAGWSMGQKGHAGMLFSAGIALDYADSDLITKVCGGDCDKTRAVRVQAPDINIRLSFTEVLTVQIISCGGLLAESLNPLEEGFENIIRIFLPDLPEPLKSLVRVTSCKAVKQKTEQKYQIGFEFVDPGGEQTERIRTFISFRTAI